jgi:type I restriction enzyme S subunit
MPERCYKGWNTCHLSSKCNLSGGYGFPDKFQGGSSSELPFVKVSDMNLRGNEKFIKSANNYVSHVLAEKMRWRPFPADSVVFAKVGAALKLNRRRILCSPTLIDNNMMAAEPLPGLDPSFLYHFLNIIDFGNFVQDGALPSINQTQVGSIIIPDIAIEQQYAIADILDSLDDNIQQTEALIEKLQRVKVGMLHDFLTRGLDENGELRDPISHPELFKVSPLGRIPRAWHIRKLNELAVFQNGKAFPSAEYRKEGIRLLRPGNLPLSEFVSWEPGNATCLSESWGSKASDYLVGGNELVMNLTAQSLEDQFLGRVCMTRPDEICLLNQRIARFRSVDCNLPFLFWALRGPLFRLQIDLNPHGTKVQHIYNRDLASITLPMPQTLEEQELISDILFLAAERIEKESTSLAKVQRMKQGLMQDLLTGRVRVTHLGEIAA